MKIEVLHIIGVSKNAIDKEVQASVDNIKKRYDRKNPKPIVICSHLSLATFDEISGSNRKATKKFTSLTQSINPSNINPAKVGVYVVFHGGTAEPINFKGLSKLVIWVMNQYPNGALQKLVLMACYMAATIRIPSDVVPLQTFCTTLNLEATLAERARLPMIAAWTKDVYTGNSGAATGRTQLKPDDKYVQVTDDTRTESKVIAVHSHDGYSIKDYSSAAGQWHDGAIEDKNGTVVHVRS